MNSEQTPSDYVKEPSTAENEYRPRNENFEPKLKYIAFPHALRLLAQRGITECDFVAAVFYGPEFGGLQAYDAFTESEHPLPFFYARYAQRELTDSDYLSPLMGCKFLADDIANFSFSGKYISGHELVKRWQEQFGMDPKPYIVAKIRERSCGLLILFMV